MVVRNHFTWEDWGRDEPRLFAIVVPPNRPQRPSGVYSRAQSLARKAQKELATAAPGFLSCVPEQWLHIPLLDLGWSSEITAASYDRLLRAMGDRLYRLPAVEPFTIRVGAPQVRADSVALAIEEAELPGVGWCLAQGATEALGGGRPAEFDFYIEGDPDDWRRRRDQLPDPHTTFTAFSTTRRLHLPIAYGTAEDETGAEFAVLDAAPRLHGYAGDWDEARLDITEIHLADLRQDPEAGHYTWTPRDVLTLGLGGALRALLT
uniref:hypothetical protein n=1 Tax=Amycolatopsis sp. CA-293810 TaxID=3239926 RepID=UPI003F4962D7